MKKLLLAGVAIAGLVAGASAASAADLPVRSAPPPAPMIAAIPIFTWTGFYVGAQVGYAWGDNNNDNIPGGAFVATPAGTLVPFDGGFGGDNDGFLAGVHAGYNYQFGSIVVGVEGDIEGVFGGDDNDFNGVLFDRFGNLADVAFSANSLDWQGSIRGRVGFAFDRALIYATGGFAFGGVSGGFSQGLLDNNDDTLTGWTLGAGVEYAITNNLTTRVEYRYTNFSGNDSVFNNINFGGGDLDFHTVRVGLSYKF
jgi:outer membrane immunogenic protein